MAFPSSCQSVTVACTVGLPEQMMTASGLTQLRVGERMLRKC